MGLFSFLKLRQIEKNTRQPAKSTFEIETANVEAERPRNWTREELDKHPELINTPGGAWAR
jgi:hypothetical protein